MKKLGADFAYLPDMYNDGYFPDFLVDKVKAEIEKVAVFLEDGCHTAQQIQEKFDAMTVAINDLQEEFEKNDSEIETGAREDIGDTLQRLLDFFELEIDCETAIRMRDW